jgi:hypothetical protein
MPLPNAEEEGTTNSQLDTIIKLLAGLYVRQLNNNDAIVKLDKLQLSREQIADAVGVSTHNVAQVLYASKKATEKKGKKGEADKPGLSQAAAAPAVEVSQ